MITVKKIMRGSTAKALKKTLKVAGKEAYGAYARGVHNFHENEKRAILKERARVKKTGRYFAGLHELEF